MQRKTMDKWLSLGVYLILRAFYWIQYLLHSEIEYCILEMLWWIQFMRWSYIHYLSNFWNCLKRLCYLLGIKLSESKSLESIWLLTFCLVRTIRIALLLLNAFLCYPCVHVIQRIPGLLEFWTRSCEWSRLLSRKSVKFFTPQHTTIRRPKCLGLKRLEI